MREHPITITNPIEALNHTNCPICKKELDKEWRCKKCHIQVYFKVGLDKIKQTT